MQRDKLVYMANQIALFFQSQPPSGRVSGIAGHINAFWEPRMRRQLSERLASGNTQGIHPLVLEAADHIRRAQDSRL